MNNEELAAKLKVIRAEIAKHKQAALELDMDDAIILAYKAGVLACHPNFRWRDLEIQ